MQDRTNRRRSLGVYLFAVGVLLGMLFAGLAIWADLEASQFDRADLMAEASFEGLRCPPIITSEETATISATFENPSEAGRLRTVRVHISEGFVTLMREETAQFFLEPGESERLSFTVTPADAAWDRVIMVRVIELRNPPLPGRTGTCGILVLGIPFVSGAVVTALMVGLSLALMGGGAILWVRGNRVAGRPMQLSQGVMLFTGVVVVVAMVLGLLGNWLLGGLLLLLAILLIVTTVALTLSQ